MLEVLYHHAKFGGDRISPATGVAKNVEFLVCLSVCLLVTLLNVRDCAPDLAMKALEYRNDFDAVGYGKVCTRVQWPALLHRVAIKDHGNATAASDDVRCYVKRCVLSVCLNVLSDGDHRMSHFTSTATYRETHRDECHNK